MKVPRAVAEQVAAVPEEGRVCGWHPTWDPVTHLPTGDPCGRDATYVILFWTPTGREQRWSLSCDKHYIADLAHEDGWLQAAWDIEWREPEIVYAP